MKAAMPVLSNSKHEQFAMAIAKGVGLAEAYISAGYSECGAKQSAARLLRNANIRSRVAQIQAELSVGTIALEISNRNARVRALQDRWDRMRQVIDQRAASPDFAKVPGGTTELLCRDLRCKDMPVYKVDSGCLAELRAHEQQAAQELSQWQTRSAVEEPKVIDVTPATMTLAMVMTAAELEELFGADGPAQ
jgi:Terminase small subunit